jgi:hypothetical protein
MGSLLFSTRAISPAECFSNAARIYIFHLFELPAPGARAFTAPALYQLIIHFGPIIVIVM